ncbi:hypothetical protein HYZ99_01535 [Candidatus Peregrinibacteria bacterium]|nr:hypothetical protein [Candidatus Peregrinibacteria bacterium]
MDSLTLLRHDRSRPTWLRSLRAGWRQWRQGMTAVSVASLTGSLLLIQLILVLILSVLWVEQTLLGKSVIRLELLASASAQDVQELFSELSHRPFIADASLVTAEQAFEQERARSSALTQFVEAYELQNPFSDRIDVLLATPSSRDALYAFLRSDRWKTVLNPAFLTGLSQEGEQAGRSLQLAWIARFVSAGFLVVSCMALLFLLLDMMKRRLALRRNEVVVSELAGGSPHSVAVPFAVELTIMLLLALVLSILMLSALTSAATFLLADSASTMGQLLGTLRESLPSLLLLEFMFAPLIGLLVSLSALRLHRANTRSTF